jgi:PAS domain S-box-containing protein
LNTLSIPVVAMASISLYVGLYHLLIYIRRPQYREDLTFAFLCFANVFYDAFCVGLYNATSVIEGAWWQRGQLITLAVFVPTILWFVSDYTHQKIGIVVHGFSIFYLLAIIVQLVDRSSLTWLVDQPSIKHFVMLFGLSVTYFEATFGPFTMVQSFMGIIASTYLFVMTIRYFRGGNKKQAAPLVVALGFMYIAAFHDTMVGNGLYHSIYLMEYAYLGVIVVMANSLSNKVVEAAIAKDALRKSEEWFRSLVETTSDWVWEVDKDGVYTYASPKIRELLGYEPEEIIGQTPFDLMLSEETKRVSKIFQNSVRSNKPIERVENICQSKDGRSVVLETSGIPFFDENGKLSGYRGIDRDITERKQTEQMLQMFQYTVDQASEAIYWLNHEAKFEYVNDQACRSLGYTREEMMDLTLWNIDPLYPKERWRQSWGKYQEHKFGDVSNVESIHCRKDGSAFPVEVTSKPFWFGDKELHVAVVRDITERKLTEAEREKLIANLESKNAELERFAYTASHDLKSPLITIRGFLSYIEKDAQAGNITRLNEDIKRVGEATEKMYHLLNELLELSRIGRLMNKPISIHFEELAREAVELVQGRILERGTEVHIDPNMPTVFGDRQRLLEVLQNLVDNAAKFMTSQANPRIEIGQQGEEDGKPIFFVKDNGIGIEPQHHERVFGLFNKLDPDTEGTGVGLAIVKRIIEVHGGRVWIENNADEGITFFFTLPVKDDVIS